jgi:hypothetical protein
MRGFEYRSLAGLLGITGYLASRHHSTPPERALQSAARYKHVTPSGVNNTQ